VQHGVAEHGVELPLRSVSARPPCVEARARAAPICSALLSMAITRQPAATAFSVSAPSPQPSEDPLPGLGREQLEDPGAKVGNKARVPGIGIRIPLLSRHKGCAVRHSLLCRGVGRCIEKDALSGPAAWRVTAL
jgi:hypothetical protein